MRIEDYIEGIEERLHLFVNDSRSEITELAVSFCDNLYVDCLSFPLIAYRQEPTVCVDAVVKLTVHEKLTVSPSEVDEERSFISVRQRFIRNVNFSGDHAVSVRKAVAGLQADLVFGDYVFPSPGFSAAQARSPEAGAVPLLR